MPKSEILGLIGPNGSGKTTLVNCISGVLKIDDGAISLRTRASHGPPGHAGRGTGLARTFQSPRLFTRALGSRERRVGSECMPRTPSGSVHRRVDSLLERLELAESQPHGRLESAVRLPAASRDRASARRQSRGPAARRARGRANDLETPSCATLLLEIRNEHACAIIVIDHDMNLIMNVSDRVQVLDEGRVIFIGAPADAFKQTAVVEAYLGAE